MKKVKVDRYMIDWGDGSRTVETLWKDGKIVDINREPGAHEYAEPGTYTVKMWGVFDEIVKNARPKRRNKTLLRVVQNGSKCK